MPTGFAPTGLGTCKQAVQSTKAETKRAFFQFFGPLSDEEELVNNWRSYPSSIISKPSNITLRVYLGFCQIFLKRAYLLLSKHVEGPARGVESQLKFCWCGKTAGSSHNSACRVCSMHVSPAQRA